MSFIGNLYNKIFGGMDSLKEKEEHATRIFIEDLLDRGYIDPKSRNIIDLDYWESYNTTPYIVPGCIYIFTYKSEEFTLATEYETSIEMNNKLQGKSKLTKKLLLSADEYLFKIKQWIADNSFYEVLPTVLVRKLFSGKNGETYIHGINLNYCSKEVKEAIINELYTIDPNYFDKTVWDLAKQESWEPSEKIAKTVINDKWLKYIALKYQLTNIDLLSRTYKLSSIGVIRYVDIWMYNYIPYLNYKDCITNQSLATVQKWLLETKMPYYKLPQDIKL